MILSNSQAARVIIEKQKLIEKLEARIKELEADAAKRAKLLSEVYRECFL